MTNYEDYDDYEDRLKYLDPSDIKKYKIQNGSGLFLTAFDGKFVFEPQVVCNLNDSYSINVFEILYCFFEENAVMAKAITKVALNIVPVHCLGEDDTILAVSIRDDSSPKHKIVKKFYCWYPLTKNKR